MGFYVETRTPAHAALRLDHPRHAPDRKRVVDHGRTLHAEYAATRLFPHVVIDDFFAAEALDALIAEFPSVEDRRWLRDRESSSGELVCTDESALGPDTRMMVARLHGGSFIEFLEAVTGIPGLIPDPHLSGGGLRCIPPGGRLDLQPAFAIDERLRLDRRLTVAIYLNRDWREEWGGHLELWNRTRTRVEERLVPLANRAVIFETSEMALYGQPATVQCPATRACCSIALHYYTSGRPLEELRPQPSSYRERFSRRFHVVRNSRSAIRRFLVAALANLGVAP